MFVAACATPPATPSSTPTPAPAVTSIPSGFPDFTEAAETWRLLAAQGNIVWPGWGQALPPLLIRSGEYDYLIGHPAPPAGFTRVADLTVAGQPVYRQSQHLVPVPAATTWDVAGVWSLAAPARAEFQRAIDAQLGQGAIKLDSPGYVRALVHEAFHAYAMTRVQRQVPNFGADGNEAELIQQLAAVPNSDRLYTAEGAALAQALQAADDDTARAAAVEFLKLRHARRASGDQTVAAYEQTTEWVEGLARYAEVALMQRADRAGKAPFDYPAAADVWQQFLMDLAQPASGPDGFRGRYYLLGAGQAFLLDRLLPAWKTRVLDERQALEDVLNEAVEP